MSNSWFVRSLVTGFSILVPLTVSAQNTPETRCVHGDMQRRVAIVYETGVAVPCEVHYFKDTEAPGEPQVLWNAQSESGYCESKAQAFVEKLEGWGWTCATISPAEAANEGEDLIPATESEANG